MSSSRYLKIYAGWILAISFVLLSIVLGLTPLAGLLTLLVVLAPLAVVIAPTVHAVMVRQGAETAVAMSVALGVVALLVIILGMTGVFDFARARVVIGPARVHARHKSLPRVRSA